MPGEVISLTQSSIQTINFYQLSSTPFNLNLDQLDRDIKYLTSANTYSSVPVSLIFKLSYQQSSNSTTKAADKVFTLPFPLGPPQISNLLNIYSTLRSVGSGNPDRSLDNLANTTISINVTNVNSDKTAYKIAE